MTKENKKTLILTIVAVLALIIVVVGATYAYFVAAMGDGTSTNLNATTGTTDSLSFKDGNRINIYATTENFGEGKGNQADSTMVSATLIANNGTNYAKYNYYMYLDISENELVYTTSEKTPELIMTITDKEGTSLTSIDGLNYVTVGDVSGFDITESQGLITILNNYEIETTSTETHEWNITITLVNLDNNQKDNLNKTFLADVKIQKEELVAKLTTLATVCEGQSAASCIVENYGIEQALYYHDTDGVKVNGKLIEENSDQGAEDNSYRYVGKDPANYVCFGSNESTCSADNLYRIIGIFNNGTTSNPEYQIKLIKSTSLGNYLWSGESLSNNSNIWANSTLNTGTLNGTYLNELGEEWTNKIATHTWQVGGSVSL